jgi:hypothetical protein
LLIDSNDAKALEPFVKSIKVASYSGSRLAVKLK